MEPLPSLPEPSIKVDCCCRRSDEMKAVRFGYGAVVTTLTKKLRYPSHEATRFLPLNHNHDYRYKSFNLPTTNLEICRSYSSSGPGDRSSKSGIDPISVASTVSYPNSQHQQDDGVSAIDAVSSLHKPVSMWPDMYQ
ncbi:hypothetical protein LXL04_008270 [Taraxacum kok-saghyz]